MARIGILGGTFNPLHNGHMALAEEARAKLSLDKLIFVPACIPPHKSAKDIIPARDRYEMILLALEDRPEFEVSDIEIKLKGKSYSINTVKKFKDIYGKDAEIFFITGSDSLQELAAWKDIAKLKDICTFVIAARPGYAAAGQPAGTIFMKADTPDISSTDIRRRVKEGEPFRGLVPIGIYNSIIIRKLYL